MPHRIPSTVPGWEASCTYADGLQHSTSSQLLHRSLRIKSEIIFRIEINRARRNPHHQPTWKRLFWGQELAFDLWKTALLLSLVQGLKKTIHPCIAFVHSLANLGITTNPMPCFGNRLHGYHMFSLHVTRCCALQVQRTLLLPYYQRQAVLLGQDNNLLQLVFTPITYPAI